MTVHAYTSFSYSYLNRARVLGATLKEHHPDWVLWAFVTDKAPIGLHLNLAEEPFDYIVESEILFGEGFDSWVFCHDIVEACTAIKGRALLHILDQPEVSHVLFFDPDIAIFSKMDDIIDQFKFSSIGLTPHQISFEDDEQAILDNEIASLHYGIFNLGFLAVKNDIEGRRFANWWSLRLDYWCFDRLDIGVFVDQKWCNLIPCFFDDVFIFKDPGMNVASWNLSKRNISVCESGALLVNGKSLKFFHFTKLGPIGNTMTERYAADNEVVFEIWAWYERKVKYFTSTIIPNGWWYYGYFEDGSAIPKAARELYRDSEDLKAVFPHPFKDEFRNWLSVKTDIL